MQDSGNSPRTEDRTKRVTCVFFLHTQTFDIELFECTVEVLQYHNVKLCSNCFHGISQVFWGQSEDTRPLNNKIIVKEVSVDQRDNTRFKTLALNVSGPGSNLWYYI